MVMGARPINPQKPLDQDEVPWYPLPLRLPLGRAARMAFEAIIQASGRTIETGDSDEHLDRQVQALRSGDDPVTIAHTDSQLAAITGCGTAHVQKGLRRLQQARWIVRTRGGPRRTIRLTTPTAQRGKP
jgi:hypothetical protein